MNASIAGDSCGPRRREQRPPGFLSGRSGAPDVPEPAALLRAARGLREALPGSEVAPSSRVQALRGPRESARPWDSRATGVEG